MGFRSPLSPERGRGVCVCVCMCMSIWLCALVSGLHKKIKSHFLAFWGIIKIFFWEKRDKENMSRRERGGEREPQAGSTSSMVPDAGFSLINCEIMTGAKIKSRMLNQLSHPGASIIMIFKQIQKNLYFRIVTLVSSKFYYPYFTNEETKTQRD